MKIVKHSIFLIFLFIQNIVFSQVTFLNPVRNKYDSVLTNQQKGVAMLVKKNKKIEAIGLGTFNLTENSVFNIGSATKTFTALLILQEMERGNLKLSDSIGRYLNPIKNVNGALTIENLLTHESGLDEVIGKNMQTIFFSQQDSLYQKNLLDNIGKNHPEQIGKFHYCNTNYLLLGKIVEKITDQNYFDLLRERIFIPAQMHASYPYLNKNIPNLATPYLDDKNVTTYLDHRYFSDVANAAGSIASTLIDMERFYTCLFETNLLLKPETVALMKSSGNETYGLGLFKFNRNGIITYGHGGNNIGYAFRNEYNPETKNLFMVFTNNKTIPMQESIQNDLLAVLEGLVIANFKAVNLDKFGKYVGTYLLKEAGLKMNIVLENDKMFLVVADQNIKSELTQKSDTSLFETTVGVVLSMIQGNEKTLQFKQNGFETVLQRLE